MPRLLTDEQVEHVAKGGAESVAELIWLARPELGSKHVKGLEEAVQHDLVVTLEGLMEPDEGEGS